MKFVTNRIFSLCGLCTCINYLQFSLSRCCIFFSRLAVLITVSGLNEHQRSHCAYIFLRDRPLFIFWKGQRGVGGRGAIKIYPILHTSLGCSCDRPSWRRLIPPSFPLKTMYLSLPPPKKKKKKKNFTPHSPPRARC